jgi:hypothetical protein
VRLTDDQLLFKLRVVKGGMNKVKALPLLFETERRLTWVKTGVHLYWGRILNQRRERQDFARRFLSILQNEYLYWFLVCLRLAWNNPQARRRARCARSTKETSSSSTEDKLHPITIILSVERRRKSQPRFPAAVISICSSDPRHNDNLLDSFTCNSKQSKTTRPPIIHLEEWFCFS